MEKDLRRYRTSNLNSPRHLFFRHGNQLLRRLENDAETEAALGPGMMQLFSSYVPGIEAAKHKIDVEQVISAPGSDSKTVGSHHNFNVVAPRFALPAGTIHSIYPPEGHTARPEVLPHVVFTEPTLPWERTASNERLDDSDFNGVPWLAVLLFTQDELRQASSTLKKILPSVAGVGEVAQSTTMAVNVPVTVATQLQGVAAAIPSDVTDREKSRKTDLIFIPKLLFSRLFGRYNQDGSWDSSQKRANVAPYRYLAHIRNINLDGMAAAATSEHGDHAFSVIMSPRMGPLDISQPTTVIAHLVNLESVENVGMPIAEDLVAMPSLYSWQYICLPPNSLDVAHDFLHLGENTEFLRPQLTSDDQNKINWCSGLVGPRLQQRLNNGFTLVSYRVQTGEETAAWMRGPCTPTLPPNDLLPLATANSITGANLQILDQELNIMDISYSAAWQLGKALALADQAFLGALGRVRKRILDIATNEAQVTALALRATNLLRRSPYRSRVELIEIMAEAMKALASLPGKRSLAQDPFGMTRRWFQDAPPPLDLSYRGNEVDNNIDQHMDDAARKIASSVDDDGNPYNEFNSPYSTDWAVVLRWVLDRLYLVNVPPHYLITNSSNLPLETIRFFHIDSNWVNAMVDGGLSLANHLDKEDDPIRTAIKRAINWYLSTTISKLHYPPPTPTYGFFLRSELVTKFPDLVVDHKPPPNPANPPLVLRQEILDTNIIFCLLNKAPSSDFTALSLREPPHQQYFAAATSVTSTGFELNYKLVSTTTDHPPDAHNPIQSTVRRDDATNTRRGLLIWGTKETSNEVRMLNMEYFAKDFYNSLKNLYQSEQHPEFLKESFPTAAMIGIQLNEPCWELTFQIGTNAMFNIQCDHVRSFPTPLPRPKQRLAQLDWRPRHVPCAPHPSFAERQRETPLNTRNSPPHFRLPVSVNSPAPTHSTAQLAATAEASPIYRYSVFSPGGRPGDPVHVLPTKQDLIFSIVYESGAMVLDMMHLDIEIPIALSATPLIDSYARPGPTMLSNMRLVPIQEYLNGKPKTLVLSLVPRSSLNIVPTARISEMSFMLRGVMIHSFQKSTTVSLKVSEYYSGGLSDKSQFIQVNLVVP